MLHSRCVSNVSEVNKSVCEMIAWDAKESSCKVRLIAHMVLLHPDISTLALLGVTAADGSLLCLTDAGSDQSYLPDSLNSGP